MSSEGAVLSLNLTRGILHQECVPEWDQNSTTLLIQMYKERKCLWDTTHEFYKNRRLRREAFTGMANHFSCSLADVEKKIYMLRSSFRKEYRRWNQAKLCAATNNVNLVRKPQWFALDLLMFLKDHIAKKTMQTSLNSGEQFINKINQDLDIANADIQNLFYYDSENSTLTPLETGEVSLDYNLQQIGIGGCDTMKESTGSVAPGSLKRSSNQPETTLLELTNKKSKPRGDADDSRTRLMKPVNELQDKDGFTAFGNFVAQELKNIKDNSQIQLAKLRIHQVLFDATRSFLKVPIPRL